MKKLICESDIRALSEKGEAVCRIDSDTIVTPSARDEAARIGITIENCGAPELISRDPSVLGKLSSWPSETLDCLIQLLVERGYLTQELLQERKLPEKPYKYEKDIAGLKVVRGRSVRLEEFFPGNSRIQFQELIDKEDSSICSGILVIDHDEYKWTQSYDENDYVLEGTLTITVDGRCYTAQEGDCIFIPKGTTVIMGSKTSRCKVFYNAYPSNWADGVQ